ncbi:MAG TPA: HNH endonuclease [Pyrinomonadaceae bacterium]|nr:HNH endonuclease [Pyrinomonadaceae bacterium]
MTMKPTSIDDVIFEMKDTEIFKIPDMKTRIATVQNYFFPRLEMLLINTIDLIQEVYDVNPYERMTYVYYPSNRKTARQNRDFYHVHIGLSGKRRLNRELKYKRRDGKAFRLHPSHLIYKIDFEGSIQVEFHPFRQYVSSEFISTIADLYAENFVALSPIFGLHQISHDRDFQFINLKDAFVGEKEDINYNYFYSPTYYFPVSMDRGLWRSILCFVALYPLLDALNAIGEGDLPSLPEMLGKLKQWHLMNEPDEKSENKDEPDGESIKLAQLPELDSYIFIRAGVWWSVLARDNWTCCSCGRSSKEDGITLEVDHIVPRSKSGSNDMDNLQTLCKKCNIGKSNKDSTDLRRRA